MVCALHRAVAGNIGADERFYAYRLHLCSKIHGLELGFFGPALYGHVAVADVYAYRDLFTVEISILIFANSIRKMEI
jgi:hypothetical protein